MDILQGDEPLSLWDSGDDGDYDDTPVIKRCNCGYKGVLDLDPNGYSCPNCSYLLIPKK